jgi:hypothetical protein
VRYLELMRARDGETSEVLDIRVEVESSLADDASIEEDDHADELPLDDEPVGGMETEIVRPTSDAEERRDLVIPDDPTVLSYLLSGIVQIELPRRQALLEASTTVERLEALVRLLEREILLLTSRLRLFAPDPRLMRGPRRS